MSFIDEEFFLVNKKTKECFELGPGNWKQIFKTSVAANVTVDKALKHVYKSAERRGLLHVEDVVNKINEWIINTGGNLEIVKTKLSETGLKDFTQTGSRFDLVAPLSKEKIG